jgi:16S rRNA (cytosine967-C5)-methyltransferase
MRRHPDIKYLRQPEDVLNLAKLQRRILRAIWPLLKPGGRLLYATCSLLEEENEQQVRAFITQQADAEELPITASWGEACQAGRQIAPGELGMDGFYYALLWRRPE